MSKSARSSAPEPSRSQQIERLTDAVNHLAEEFRVVRDVLSEFQTDFSWLLQNGVPHQPQELVVVKRMARDPLAQDWSQRLVVERFPITGNTTGRTSTATDDLEAVALELQSAFVGIAEEQLDLVLTMLDELRSRILSALARQDTEPLNSPPASALQNAPGPNAVPASCKQGELF